MAADDQFKKYITEVIQIIDERLNKLEKSNTHEMTGNEQGFYAFKFPYTEKLPKWLSKDDIELLKKVYIQLSQFQDIDDIGYSAAEGTVLLQLKDLIEKFEEK